MNKARLLFSMLLAFSFPLLSEDFLTYHIALKCQSADIDTALFFAKFDDQLYSKIQKMTTPPNSARFALYDGSKTPRYELMIEVNDLIVPDTQIQRINVAKVQPILDKHRAECQKVLDNYNKVSPEQREGAAIITQLAVNSILIPVLGIGMFNPDAFQSNGPEMPKLNAYDQNFVWDSCSTAKLNFMGILKDKKKGKEETFTKSSKIVLTAVCSDTSIISFLIKQAIENIESDIR